MTNHSQVESLPVVTYNSLPVITTDMLAQVYGTETIRIQQNHKRNDDRFIAGKHFFKLEGTELKAFKNRLSLSESVGKHARSLVLWTERGAARHAKMLETDQAWEVFEKLEDFYFSQKEKAEQVRKNRQCTATQLTPLRQTVERLITTGLGKIYPDIWKLVHQRFDVEHIHQLQPEQVGEAIEYLNVLEGEYLGRETLPATTSVHFTTEELCALCWVWNAAEYMREKIELAYPAMRTLKSEYAPSFYSMAFEYQRTLEAGRKVLERETKHIVPHPHSVSDENWRRVLPRLRQNSLPRG
ncbi:ORF6N domain-containing protein [Escherichia coli]